MPCPTPKLVRGYSVSCGSCAYCLKMKRWFIKSRIVAETSISDRTWFMTLTLRKKMSDKVGYKLVQRWLKRMRKAKLSVRYAAIAEHGSSGTKRLHYHVMLHGTSSLTYRAVRRHWRGGFAHLEIVSNASAASGYGSKMAGYVTKKGDSRFRFSLGYGSRGISSICSSDLVRLSQESFPDARITSVRIGGDRIHPRLLPERPEPEPVWITDRAFMREVEDTRRAMLEHKAVTERRLALLRQRPRAIPPGIGVRGS